MRPTTARAGFTLLEMMLVLAISAILIALTLPALKGMVTRSQEQEAAYELTEFIEQSCRIALTRSEVTCVTMVAPPPTLTLELGRPNGLSCLDVAGTTPLQPNKVFLGVNTLVVQHFRPPANLNTAIPLPAELQWACDELGRPAGVLGTLVDFGQCWGLIPCPLGNNNPRPRLQVQASYEMGTELRTNVYPSGVVTRTIE